MHFEQGPVWSRRDGADWLLDLHVQPGAKVTAVVGEHVVADEVDHPLRGGPRDPPPTKQLVGRVRAHRLVADEPAVGEGGRLAEVGGAPGSR